MRRWMEEDWAFEITVLSSHAGNCRLGMEQGDSFSFAYGCPADFCPRTMIEVFTWCEVVRCGGDFLARGSREKYAMEFDCPCHVVRFRLEARHVPLGDRAISDASMDLEEEMTL